MALSDVSIAGLRRAVFRRPSRRFVAFSALLLVYLLVTLGVVYRSPLLTLDTDVFKLDLHNRYPEWRTPIRIYVMLGQRGPATLLFLPWFCWVAWRNRTPRPLVTLGVGLVLLNLSVGLVKLATGRLGPLQTSNTHRIFDGGNIYPSGHVSNAVVLYGLIAMIAVNHRRLAATAAAFLSVTVGLGTVYRDTHWFSDVVGGWIAGGLVLIAVPWVMPFAQRCWDWACTRLARRASWARYLRMGRPTTGAPVAGSTVPPRLRGGATGSARPAPARPLTAGARHSSVTRLAAPARPRPAAPVLVPAPAAQPTETPVSSVAAAHSFSATRRSLDARDESTRRGNPRTSPIPSGP